MIKKGLYALLNVVSIAAIVLALVALLSVVLTPQGEAPTLAGYSMMRILTGSMEPTIPTGSLILVKRTPPEEIQPGDIISFYSVDPRLEGSLNTHRVVSVENTADGYVYTTQGDANVIPDKYPVQASTVVGTVRWFNYLLGVAVGLLSQPIAFFLVVAIPLAAMTITNLYKVIRSALDVMKAEEQEAVNRALAELKKRRDAEEPPPDPAQNTTQDPAPGDADKP